jgi:alkyl hydroperoxide reductase subunit AhpF
MALIGDPERPEIKKALSAMNSEVTLTYFTQEMECDFCRETHGLLEELCAIEERVKLQIYDFKKNPDEVAKYRIDKIPAIAVGNGSGTGIRFYGIPAGYEFSSLIEAILMVSCGESGLSAESKKLLKEIKVPIHLQVFVTPT